MIIWFNKSSKSISFRFYSQHWKLIQWKNNGAIKGRIEDTCYDLNIYFLGFFFGYTNWSYNRHMRKYNINEVREQKLKRILNG